MEIYWLNLLNKILLSDWSQFIPTMIATFVGFILAILGTWIYDTIDKKNECNNLKKDIRNELLKVQNVLIEIEAEDNRAINEKNSILRINPLKCYIWDSAISANKVNLLTKLVWYSELLQIYDTINDYNEWQLLKSDKILEGKDITAINEHIENLKTNIIFGIRDIIDKLNT